MVALNIKWAPERWKELNMTSQSKLSVPSSNFFLTCGCVSGWSQGLLSERCGVYQSDSKVLFLSLILCQHVYLLSNHSAEWKESCLIVSIWLSFLPCSTGWSFQSPLPNKWKVSIWQTMLGTPKKNKICHDCVFKVSLWEKKMHIFSILNVCVTFVGNIFFAPIDFFFLVKLMKNYEFPLFLPPKNHGLYLAKVHFCFHHSSPISRL